ncbi:MAG: LysR substrate-binding domain-containing protein [Actinomycetota bacterium]|nr:LysR substrate-binding domain-containing protein [Actinomycetota bacterium]
MSTRGSFAAAADALSFTPSAVSQQMASLAREMDIVLFERTPRGMRLTESARALLIHCEAVFARLSDAQAELDAIAGGVRGRLRLGSFPTATVAFTAVAMDAFRRRYGGVEIFFADGEPYESVSRLKERELDLAVLFDFDHWTAATDYDGRAVCEDCDIECAELFDDPFHVVLPRGHRLAGQETVDLTDLAEERVIGSPSVCSPWGADFRALCHEAGFEPDFEPRYRSADFASLQAIVATDHGITLVPELALRSIDAGVIVLPLRGGPVRHVRLATLAGVAPTSAGESMAAVLKEATAALFTRGHAAASSVV